MIEKKRKEKDEKWLPLHRYFVAVILLSFNEYHCELVVRALLARYTLSLFFPVAYPVAIFELFLGGVRLRESLSIIGRVVYFLRGVAT